MHSELNILISGVTDVTGVTTRNGAGFGVTSSGLPDVTDVTNHDWWEDECGSMT
jgi:hypothetical protein